MNSVLASTPPAPLTLHWFAPVAKDLQRVDEILRESLRSEAPYVDELLTYVADLGGKRLRPALLLLTAKSCGEILPAHHTLAAVVEMIHTATLVHDDILDGADERRHRSTVHRRWGTKAAILLGDHLFSRAFHLSSTVGDAETCEIIGRSTNIVCEGELQQSSDVGCWEMSENSYLTVIGQKTAELCACCCELGARHAGADEDTVLGLRRYGHLLGLAFQIADDVLDLTGHSELAGKSLGTDLDLGKPTLPIIHWLNQFTDEARKVALVRLQDVSVEPHPRRHRHEALLADMLVTGSIQYAMQRAEAYAAAAARELEKLPPSPTCDAMRKLCHFVVSRTK